MYATTFRFAATFNCIVDTMTTRWAYVGGLGFTIEFCPCRSHSLYHADTCSTVLTLDLPCWHSLYHTDAWYTMLTLALPYWHLIYHADTRSTVLKLDLPCWQSLCRNDTWSSVHNTRSTVLTLDLPCWHSLYSTDTWSTMLTLALPYWHLIYHADTRSTLLTLALSLGRSGLWSSQVMLGTWVRVPCGTVEILHLDALDKEDFTIIFHTVSWLMFS